MAHLLNACELTRKGSQWARTRHPWVYRDDVAAAAGEDGDIVRVTSEGQTLGSAFLGTRSKIALRWIERSPEPRSPDPAFWEERIARAIRRRSEVAAVAEGYRVIHDAADGIPGLVADRYGPVVVLQSTIAGTERLLPIFTDICRRLLGAAAIVARNDVAVREKEGLPREVRVLAGECPARVWVAETGPAGRLEYPVDPLHGQKTGAFLDQRENRWAAARRARGRVLDLFSYTGLFALHAARSAAEVIAVDTSGPALELLGEAAARNGLAGIRSVRANVFDYLKELGGEARGSFGAVVLDPPAFAKSRAEVPAAARAYREINRRAMGLLAPGGVLVTCSCSYNLSEERFLEILREAGAEARADFRIVERRAQASDHPMVLGHPESAYLKCLVLEKE
jgi:23S rRNA (cytosine1962-C5)-methyltransferase